MFRQALILLVTIGCLEGKPIIVRNISDCSITEDGILHYQGKHSFTRFEHECLRWTDLQTVYPDIINEPNFFTDPSIKAAKNFCRNPNMNANGPWCYVQDEETISVEECDVCQSLAIRSTVPTDLDELDNVTVPGMSPSLLQRIRDDLKRYGIYIREKFREIIERVSKKFNQVRSRINDHFNFNWK